MEYRGNHGSMGVHRSRLPALRESRTVGALLIMRMRSFLIRSLRKGPNLVTARHTSPIAMRASLQSWVSLELSSVARWLNSASSVERARFHSPQSSLEYSSMAVRRPNPATPSLPGTVFIPSSPTSCTRSCMPTRRRSSPPRIEGREMP